MNSRKDLIETAIARGESLDWIIDHLGVDPTVVDRALARMDAAHHGHPYDYGADTPDVDEVIVQRIMTGRPRPSRQGHTAELREAIRRLADDGLNDGKIAYQLHTSRAAIAHFRNRHGIPAASPDTRTTSPGSWRTALTTRRTA